MERFDQIKAGLYQLDPADDAHWTAPGLPRLDLVRQLSGVDDASRAEINAAMPGYDREKARDAAKSAEPSTQPLEPVAEPLADPAAELERQKAACQAQVDAIRDEVAALRVERDAIDNKLKMLGQKQALVEQAFNALFPPMRPEEAVKAYQRRSQGQRVAASAPAQPMSPLDRAMKDRRGFGLDRPEPFLLERN